VIHLVHDLPLDYLLQGAEIDDVASPVVDVTLDLHIQDIVVAMPVRVVALPEDGGVLLVGERRIVDAMRRIEA